MPVPLRTEFLDALGIADLSKYKDSMCPLLERDIAETKRMLEASGFQNQHQALTAKN